MRCPRCLNEDPTFFYKGVRGYYCRKCISFSRVCVEESMQEVSLSIPSTSSEEYFLDFPLTEEQKLISHKCACLIDKTDVLISAVTGAGKTELVVETIAKMLNEKKKVCFAIARRQVVLELTERFKKIFLNAKVVGVCGGYTSELDGDLIVCTTHQLYRYYHAFDLLILDEPDAFPFYGDPVLHGIASTACVRHTIYLTATPDDELLRKIKEKTCVKLELNHRPHGKPVPVPIVFCSFYLIGFIKLLSWIKEYQETPRMIFVPTIEKANILSKVLSIFEHTYCCTSKTVNRDEVIEKFRNEKHGLIVCTTVLERGVTIKNVNICVFEADHSIFTSAALIQMAGRAGRNYYHPEGNVLFITQKRTKKINDCIKDIERANNS